jgi:hypothetical protein
MPQEDIKDGCTEIKIDGQPYKIAFDHNAIYKAEELLGGYIDIVEKIMNDEIKTLKERLSFCLTGFLKYHPDITISEIEKADNYDTLWTSVCLEFIKKTRSPEIYEGLVIESQNTKKKIKELNGLTSVKKDGKIK